MNCINNNERPVILFNNLPAKNFLIPGIISLIKLQYMHGHSPAFVTPIEQHHCILHEGLAKWRLPDRVFHRPSIYQQQFQLSELLSAKKYNFNFKSLINNSWPGLTNHGISPLRQAFQRWQPCYLAFNNKTFNPTNHERKSNDCVWLNTNTD
jgi:hypothetical protein